MTLSVNELLLPLRAETATGLSNWGEDEAFRVGLAQLVEAATVAELPPMANAGFERQIIDLLSTRLRLHPEIVAQKIERPLVLTGLPRTGTTILHDLCALDPAGRAPLEWESSRPWPAPEAATFTSDPRIAECQAETDARLDAMPILRSMHPWGATLPADFLSFLALSFVCTRFVASSYVPAYAHWLSVTKPDGVYRTHKRALQQLQWRGLRGRWILKEPQHVLDIEQLVGVYPDLLEEPVREGRP